MKYRVVRLAAEVFELTETQAELLANKAGITLHSEETFLEVFMQIMAKQEVCAKGLYRQANLSERMYQYIRKGRKPTKESVLAIGVAAGMHIEDVERLLKSAGYVLSPSNPRDAVVRWLLSRESKYRECYLPLMEINEVLQELELPLLMTRMGKSQN